MNRGKLRFVSLILSHTRYISRLAYHSGNADVPHCRCDSLMLFFLLSTDTGKVYKSSRGVLHAACTNAIQNRKCVQYFTAVCAKIYRMADNCLLFQVAVPNFDNPKIRKPIKMKREKRPLCHTKRKGGCFPKHRFTGQDIFI